MEKRALLAIVLSMLILITWQYMMPKPQEQTPNEIPGQSTIGNTPVAPSTASEKALSEKPVVQPEQAAAVSLPQYPEAMVHITTPLFDAQLNSHGGTVSGWILHTYQDKNGKDVNMLKPGSPYRALAIGVGNDFSLSDKNFKVEGGNLFLSRDRPTGSVSFSYNGPTYTIQRTYTFKYDSYLFDVTDTVNGLTEYQVTLGTAFGIHEADSSRYAHTGPVLLKGTKHEVFKLKKLTTPQLVSDELKWIGVEDKYFMSAIVVPKNMNKAKVWSPDGTSAAISLIGEPGTQTLQIYAGPKERDRLKALGMHLDSAVDFGFFSIVALPIFWLLKKLYIVVGNYGWAIILLTIIIRVPFLPLVAKSQKSMKKMQMVQPKMQEIREKYKNDPQKMNAEMMALYRKYKVNPLGGCLPLLLQLPVFLALYKVLLISIELRMAPWAFWITDLSQKDPYYVLPLIMGASMFIQQKMTPTAGDPKQQKIMMFMPIIFTFMFLNFASGLVLYWLVNNLLSITQQFFINKKKEVEEPIT